jgi:hypothetical protein
MDKISNNLSTPLEENLIIPIYDENGNAECPYCKEKVIPGQTHFCDIFDKKVEIGF